MWHIWKAGCMLQVQRFCILLHSWQYFHLTELKSQLPAWQALTTSAFTEQQKRTEKSLPLGNSQADLVGSRKGLVPSLPLPCLSVSSVSAKLWVQQWLWMPWLQNWASSMTYFGEGKKRKSVSRLFSAFLTGNHGNVGEGGWHSLANWIFTNICIFLTSLLRSILAWSLLVKSNRLCSAEWRPYLLLSFLQALYKYAYLGINASFLYYIAANKHMHIELLESVWIQHNLHVLLKIAKTVQIMQPKIR